VYLRYNPAESSDAVCFGPETYLDSSGTLIPQPSQATLSVINVSKSRPQRGRPHRGEEAHERMNNEFAFSTARRSNRNRSVRNKGLQSTQNGIVRERDTGDRELIGATDTASNDIIKPVMGQSRGRGSRSRA